MPQLATKFRDFAHLLAQHIVLPEEITPFERDYLQKMNKRAFAFLLCNVPVFMIVALIHGTGMDDALYLCGAALFGPAVASFFVKNPRTISLIQGFTAMCMGGILVHLGQGPMQIEMHFYFFMLLAILVVFANPMVIIVAALTVTAHHLLLYFLLPASVFNYDAPLWVVFVHAAFVVVESIVAVYISRSFFDNVIGLEKIVQKRTNELNARNRDMRLVLDNVSQGLLTISSQGVISPEYSAILKEWFGQLESGENFATVLGRKDASAALWFNLGLEALRDDFLPLEMCLDQLPVTLRIDEMTVRVHYTPLLDARGQVEKLLVMLSDVTAQLERERLEQEQREFVTLAAKLHEDRVGFLEFFSEANTIMEHLNEMTEEASLTEIKRLIHTLKGNSGFFGLKTIANACHKLESQIQDTCALPRAEEISTLSERWSSLRESLQSFLGNAKNTIEIDDAEYKQLLDDVLRGASHTALAERIFTWKLEPAHKRMERLAEQAQLLSQRLGKGRLEVEIDSDNTCMLPERWRGFWASFAHVLRNAIDHGIEEREVRASKGKSPRGKLVLFAHHDDREFRISISDDGGGIDWDKIRSRAIEFGLKPENHEDLVQALFVDGLSTRDEASMTSGRGVGMAAVLQQCEELGGHIIVESTPDEGTQMSFVFPLDTIVRPEIEALKAA